MKGKLLAFGVSLLAMATIGVVQLQTKAVDSSRDCDRFAVIHCGTLNAAELRAEYDSNGASGSNGYSTAQNDIKKVFITMGISRADLDLTVKSGTVYRDGTVKVAGNTVATGAQMAARGLGGNQIAGTNAQKVSVSAMSDAQTAMVFYKNGKFAFAVMKPCGNPVIATPKDEPKPEPTAKCVDLKAVRQERNKYLVTATASVSGGATVKSYHFVVTKGSQIIFDNTYQSNAASQSVVYQKLEPGDYKARVTVNTSEGPKSGTNCVVTFTVSEQPTPGVDITKFVDGDQKYARVNANVEFDYTIAVKNTGSTDLKNVVVTDTPDRGITLISVTPPSGKIENNTFTYTIPTLLKGETRTFVLKAKVPEALAGRLVNTVCVDAPEVSGNPDKCDKAEVEVPPAPVPGKIEVCVLADKTVRQISEDEYNANPSLYSKVLTDCDEEEVPAELPQTGPAEAALSIIGAMSLVGSTAYYVASRRQA